MKRETLCIDVFVKLMIRFPICNEFDDAGRGEIQEVLCLDIWNVEHFGGAFKMPGVRGGKYSV